jgi:hypothetical protein
VTAADDPGSSTCPKCGKKGRKDAESCPRCGLVFALWTDVNSIPAANLDEAGTALWQKIEADWNDSARHEEFLKHCLQANLLSVAGRLYRDRLDENPKDAIATQMQAQVLAKATLGLTINKTQPREPVTRTRWFWIVVLSAMAIGIAAGLLWRRFR